MNLEPLESRVTPTVSYAFSSGTLAVSLGAASDAAIISQSSTNGDITVNGTDTGTARQLRYRGAGCKNAGTFATQSVTFNNSQGSAVSITSAITVTGIQSVSVSGARPAAASTFSETGATTGVTLNANITTTGSQTFANNITLGGSVTLTHTGTSSLGFWQYGEPLDLYADRRSRHVLDDWQHCCRYQRHRRPHGGWSGHTPDFGEQYV